MRIRCIVSDMDGTLLNSKKQLPEGIVDTIHALLAKGIYVCIASGRQYENLRQQFLEVEDQLIFVAENGAYMVHQGKPIYVNGMHKKDVVHIVERSKHLVDAQLVLCGGQKAYIFTTQPQFLEEISKYYSEVQVIKSVDDIHEPIVKVAICDLLGSEQNAYPLYKDMEDTLEVVVSANIWLDISVKGQSKGTAMQYLQEWLSLEEQECMAIGDYLNDYELMKTVKYSVAMANAHPKLKEICRYVTHSNDEDGVMKVLHQVLNDTFVE